MRKMNCFYGFFTCLFSFVIILTGCEKKHLFQEEKPKSREDYFDFSTTKTFAVNIDYGFQKLENYRILFEIYGENPYETDAGGILVKKNIEPIFRAATDTDGKFSDNILLPSWVEEAYVCSDYLGAMPCTKVGIAGNSIQVKSVRDTKTRATTASAKAIYPDDLLTLGSWDIWGYPDYMLSEKATPPADLMYGIKEVLGKWTDIRLTYPDLVKQGERVETNIRKKTKIKLVFLNSTATKRNVVGYYTYPTGQAPASPEEIAQKIVAFPQAAYYYGYDGVSHFGPLNFGDQIQMKYWNGAEFVDEFPAGVSIGWFMMESAFDSKTGDIKKTTNIRYSDPLLNNDKYQRTIALYDGTQDNDMIALGFEDAWNAERGGNFGDAVFYLDMDKDAVDSGGLPSLPEGGEPTNDDNYTIEKGTLAFEDMWPRQGDYDMNDVVIAYECKVYRNIMGNRVFKVEDKFTPYNDGALYANAFGYQMHNIMSDMIESVKIEGPVTSEFMNGQSMESGQEYPTFILFDNARRVQGKSFTVTVKFRNDLPASSVKPPYNPFIVVESDKGRGKEVHLVNYPPTSLADITLLGQQDDKSRPAEDLYYVSDQSFPFALNLSGVADFNCPDESVRIDKEYSGFSGWVSSGGTQNKNWYKTKK